jgi:hypothetical protein
MTHTGTSGDGMEVEAGAGIPEQVKQRLLSVSKQCVSSASPAPCLDARTDAAVVP